MNVSRDLNVIWDFSVVGLNINKNQDFSKIFQNIKKISSPHFLNDDKIKKIKNGGYPEILRQSGMTVISTDPKWMWYAAYLSKFCIH